MTTPDEYRQRLNEIEEKLGVLYRERRTIMEQFSDEHDPVLPAPRYRTDRQQAIARCPRCGSKLTSP